MVDSGIHANSPCGTLCAVLMEMFVIPTPGVRPEDIRVAGRRARDVQEGLAFLRSHGLIESREVHDVAGKKFSGVLMSTTSLGVAALVWLRAQHKGGPPRRGSRIDVS